MVLEHDTQRQGELWVCQLGSVRYADAANIQRELAARRRDSELPDVLLLLEHPPVYTRGRRSEERELSRGEDFYRSMGIEVHATERGGRITYHGPGQLVGYPIMRIGDVDRFLRTMEAALIAALADEGVRARSRHAEGADYTGVWVRERKIASIGLHVSQHVTTHGFALNVEVDLAPFSWVVACGLPDVTMTSLALERPPGARSAMSCTRKRVAFRFAEAHGLRQRLVTPARLGIAATLAAGGGPGGPEPVRVAGSRTPAPVPA